jgi:charged multivesicular body protein 7
MTSKLTIILAIFCAVILISDTATAIKWVDLKVTFGLNVFRNFNSMPRTSEEAVEEGFSNISPPNDCTNDGKYFGFRYIQPNDPGMALMYDKNGIISGIQMNFLKSEAVTPTNLYNFDAVTMYQNTTINAQDYYTLTAYFVPPATICTTGRTKDQLFTEGTGTVLVLQNGLTPSTLINVPLDRTQATAEGWTKNQCFIGMGYHNFYKSEEFAATNCREIRPVFLLFTKSDELLGFGFAGQGFASSPRFEHPGERAIKAIIGDDVAQCLLDVSTSPQLSTMHIYFTKRPYFFHCF